jgi:hypothetical protein
MTKTANQLLEEVNEQITTICLDPLKKIGVRTRRDDLNDIFEKTYQDLICFGNWINDEELENVYDAWDEDLLSVKDLEKVNAYYGAILSKLEDEALQAHKASKYEHEICSGFPNALGGY